MFRLRRRTSLLPLFVAAALAAPATASPATGGCRDRSWVAGTTEICSGTLVHRDYVYDDYGADTGAPVASSTGALARPTGDRRYDRDHNSADLVALRLRVVANRLSVSFELNSLFTRDSTVAALAIDTDGDAATGGGAWPGLGARSLDGRIVGGVSSAGWDVLATFADGEGRIYLPAPAATTDVLSEGRIHQTFQTAVDPETNRIEGSIPMPAGDRWRVQAVTAVAGGPVMNVAFRGVDERGPWWEDLQAAALASGDISRFGAAVDVADLRQHRTRELTPVGPGMHERVYESAYTAADEVAGAPAEGMSYDGVLVRDAVFSQTYHFFGRYQPYGIYVPSTPAPHGVQLLLHARLANHSSLLSKPGLRRRLADEVDRMIVSPLGRGTSGWYAGLAERDVLDVLADVEATYDVDRDRVFAAGYSMGGYGTFRLVALHPERFAGWITWVAPAAGDCIVGEAAATECYAADMDVTRFVGNFRNVPGAMLYAGSDWAVPANHAVAVADAFRALDFPYVFYLHPAAEHLTFSVTDDWAKEARHPGELVPPEFEDSFLAQRRSPSRVTFRTDSAFDRPALGLVHDRAYWVSRIAGREPGVRDVDLRTSACGTPQLRTEAGVGAGIDPVPWTSEFRRVVGTEASERANRLEGRLLNVGSLTIDARRSCISSAPLAYAITTDGPTTLRISDGRTIEVPGAGTHVGVV